MDVYLIILRVLHIFAGAVWFGLAVAEVAIIPPVLKSLSSDNTSGKPAAPALAARLYNNPWLKIGFPISAVITVVAGLLLYYEVSDQFNADYMRLTSSIVLGTGVITGIIAFVHGGAVVGPMSAKTRKAAEAVVEGDDEGIDARLAEFDQRFNSRLLHAQISMVLVVITLFTMASARYFGN